MADILARVVCEERFGTDDAAFEYVYVSDPIDGLKPLGFIRLTAAGEWQATPARDGGWWYGATCATKREAVIYLTGFRGGRFSGFGDAELVDKFGQFAE